MIYIDNLNIDEMKKKIFYLVCSICLVCISCQQEEALYSM